MSATSVMRKTYDGIALFALLNVVFVGGLIGYLISSGAVDAAKFRKFVAVVRGAELADPNAAEPEPAVVENTVTSAQLGRQQLGHQGAPQCRAGGEGQAA